MVNFLKRWWLPFLIVSLPFQFIPSVDVPLAGHSVTVRLSMIAALIGIIIYGPSILRRLRLNILSPYFWMVAYGIVTAASLVASIDKPKSFIAVIATALCIGTGIIVGAIVKRTDLPPIAKLMFGVTVVVCAFGLYQFFGDVLGLSPHFTGLRPNYVKAVFGFPRIQATLQEPLFFANYLLLPLLLTAALLYSRSISNRWRYAQLGLLAMTMALTLSRGGIVGSVAGLGVIGVLLIREASIRSTAAVIAAAVIGIAVAIGLIYSAGALTNKKKNTAVKRYVSQSTTLHASAGGSDSDRIVDKRLAKKDFRENPVLGSGIGSFGTYAIRTDPKDVPLSKGSQTVNNEYYEVLAETGVLGALTLLGLVASLGLRFIQAWRTRPEPYTKAWLAALLATGVAYCIQYYAFSTLYIPYIWVTIGLLTALTARGVVARTQRA